jgi:hypothetical protein
VLSNRPIGVRLNLISQGYVPTRGRNVVMKTLKEHDSYTLRSLSAIRKKS